MMANYMEEGSRVLLVREEIDERPEEERPEILLKGFKKSKIIFFSI